MALFDQNSKTAYITLQVRRKTSKDWEDALYILKAGEPGLDITTGEVRFGNGTSLWGDLTSVCLIAHRLAEEYAVNGLIFTGEEDVANYAVCSTAADSISKTVELNNYKKVAGSSVKVRFSNGNTASEPTLNVSNTGPGIIKYNGISVDDVINNCNKIYEFTYDGINYVLTGSHYYVPLDEVDDSDPNHVTNGLVDTNGQLEVPLSLSIEDKFLYLNRGDGKYLSKINISDLFEDTFLSDVDYNAATNILTFSWNTESGKLNIDIDLTDLVDGIPNYSAGQGLSLDDLTFNVNISHTKSGNRDYSLSVDGSNNLYAEIPWTHTLVSAGNTGLSVKDNSPQDALQYNYSVSHMTTTSATATPGIYQNKSKVTTSVSTSSMDNGTYVSIPYITRDTYGHIGTLETRNFKITLDDGEIS